MRPPEAGGDSLVGEGDAGRASPRLAQALNAPRESPASNVATADACGDGVCGAEESKTTCAADCAPVLGCAGAERYVRYDTLGHAIVVSRETMSVSWYATAGDLDSDGTGRLGTDLATTTDDGYVLPSAPGPIHGWVVLRDDRGGVGWRRFEILAQ